MKRNAGIEYKLIVFEPGYPVFLSVIGPPKHYKQSLAASVETLKTPIYVLRQVLDYADHPQARVQAYWLASFSISPSDFISGCIVQIKNVDIPVDDQNQRHSFIDFYSELIDDY